MVQLRNGMMRAHKEASAPRGGAAARWAVARAAVACALLAGCGSTGPPRPVQPTAGCRPFWVCVFAGDPKPKLPLGAKTGKSLRLTFGADVGDHFQVPDRDQVLRTEVHDFRRSLGRGFESGFGSAFELVAAGAPADYVLEITRADLAVLSVEIGSFQVVSQARADLHYHARLLDASGRELRTSSGTAGSRSFAPQSRDVTVGVMSAVTKMYEAIEHDCFASFERLP
jgi:hypothetical protein